MCVAISQRYSSSWFVFLSWSSLLYQLSLTLTGLETIPNVGLVPDEGTLLADSHLYCSLVGSLHYPTFTRPNLSFAVH